jgi:hypothetical protein
VVTVWATTVIQVNSVVIHCYGPTTVMILAAVCAEVEAYCILMIVMTLARLGDLMPGQMLDGRLGSRLPGYHPVAPRPLRYGLFVHHL